MSKINIVNDLIKFRNTLEQYIDKEIYTSEDVKSNYILKNLIEKIDDCENRIEYLTRKAHIAPLTLTYNNKFQLDTIDFNIVFSCSSFIELNIDDKWIEGRVDIKYDELNNNIYYFFGRNGLEKKLEVGDIARIRH